MNTFERLESRVRSYCRSFPTVFTQASGAELIDVDGKCFLDFFAGAGALNYGHNDPLLKRRLLDYIENDGLTHGLDFASHAKERFLRTLETILLEPRSLEYKVMFCGPTGTNAVEAAVKLARKVTKRTGVMAFTGAFHGMTLGSLSLTGNRGKRAGAGLPLDGTTRLPYAGYLGQDVDTLDLLERFLEDDSSGVEVPAAIVVETIQAEGGVRVASHGWLRRLAHLARRHGILFIVDDIQVGCGRTGPFFSFEPARITPDIVCLSKSLSGYGLPFAVNLIRPTLDQWEPGEHNGTFRGNNLAFVTATAALERFWQTDDLVQATRSKGQRVREVLEGIAADCDGEVRGRGLIQGLDLGSAEKATEAARAAFHRGLLIETSGAENQVLKVLPPLTITAEQLERGLEILDRSVRGVLGSAGFSREESNATCEVTE